MDFKSNSKDSESKLSELEIKSNEFSSKYSTLTSEHNALKSMCSKMELQIKELNESLALSRERLKGAEEDSKNHKVENSVLQKQLNAKILECDKIQLKLNLYTETTHETRNDSKQEFKQLKNRINQLENEITNLKPSSESLAKETVKVLKAKAQEAKMHSQKSNIEVLKY